mmetsp:Transcript_42927/g.91270  ORF Transcript_42927/g.91270 Transcript_42927/m.91270 type:complete len:311 (-) Transcript_42927:552-1484(-)
MMMVPMMVPQNAVSQIAAGYPASHQYGSAASGVATHMATSPWTTSAAAHPWMTMGMGAVHYPAQRQHQMMSQPQQHQTTTGNQQAPHAAQAPGAAATATAPGPAAVGGHQQAPAAAVALAWHPQQTFAATAVAPPPPGGATQQQQPPPPHDASGSGNASPTHATHPLATGQHLPSLQGPLGNQSQGQSQAPLSYAPQVQGLQTTQHMGPAHATPAMAMYPQVSNGLPSVAFGLHPYQHHAHNNAAGQVANPLAPRGGASDPLSSSAAASTDTQHGANSSPQQGNGALAPSSDKPPAARPGGGGGNLAHCA